MCILPGSSPCPEKAAMHCKMPASNATVTHIERVIFFRPRSEKLFLISPTSISAAIKSSIRLTPKNAYSLFPKADKSANMVLSEENSVSTTRKITKTIIFAVAFRLLPIIIS